MPRSSATARHDRALLSESEVQRLLLCCSSRAPSGVRNRALIALLYCSGLRAGEVLALRPAELDLERDALSVRGARARVAHCFPAARPYLETWTAVRDALELPSGAPLFCTLKGAPLEPAYLRAMLQRLGRRARLGKRVHAHGLRDAFAARLAAEGLSARALARQLGHRQTRSTARALAAHGVDLKRARGRVTSIWEVRWTLAPGEAEVRAVVTIGERKPPAKLAPSEDPIVVQVWKPEEL